jgi:hypothetical protein
VKIEKIFAGIIIIALFLLGASLVYMLMNDQNYIFNEEPILPAHYKNTQYTETRPVTGLSMYPSISPDNTILARPYHGEELNEGQIVCYQSKDSTACHRILANYKDKVILKGDNNKLTETISPQNITYVVVGVIFS